MHYTDYNNMTKHLKTIIQLEYYDMFTLQQQAKVTAVTIRSRSMQLLSNTRHIKAISA